MCLAIDQKIKGDICMEANIMNNCANNSFLTLYNGWAHEITFICDPLNIKVLIHIS